MEHLPAVGRLSSKTCLTGDFSAIPKHVDLEELDIGEKKSTAVDAASRELKELEPKKRAPTPRQAAGNLQLTTPFHRDENGRMTELKKHGIMPWDRGLSQWTRNTESGRTLADAVRQGSPPYRIKGAGHGRRLDGCAVFARPWGRNAQGGVPGEFRTASVRHRAPAIPAIAEQPPQETMPPAGRRVLKYRPVPRFCPTGGLPIGTPLAIRNAAFQ